MGELETKKAISHKIGTRKTAVVSACVPRTQHLFGLMKPAKTTRLKFRYLQMTSVQSPAGRTLLSAADAGRECEQHRRLP